MSPQAHQPNIVSILQFIDTLEANILSAIGAVTNVTINSIKPGSIVVSNTIAFTEADSAAASQAQIAVLDALNSQDGVNALFGDSFGNVEVSNVAKATATNPSKPCMHLTCCCTHIRLV